jgi:hypothetical protein
MFPSSQEFKYLAVAELQISSNLFKNPDRSHGQRSTHRTPKTFPQVTSSGPFGGLVMVARSDQTIDLLDIASGQLSASWLQATKAESQTSNPYSSKDPVKGVHLFQTPLDGAAQLLTCSLGGAASLRKVNFQEEGGPAEGSSTVAEWGVGAGVESLAVEGKVKYETLDCCLYNLTVFL